MKISWSLQCNLMYVNVVTVAMTLEKSPPRSYPQFHSIIFSRKPSKIHPWRKAMKGHLLSCSLLLTIFVSCILIFVELGQVPTSTVNYPRGYLVNTPMLFSYLIMTTELWSSCFSSWVEDTPLKNWTAQDSAFLVILIMFLHSAILPTYNVSKAFSFSP